MAAINVDTTGKDSITLATADTYVDKNIVINLSNSGGEGSGEDAYELFETLIDSAPTLVLFFGSVFEGCLQENPINVTTFPHTVYADFAGAEYELKIENFFNPTFDFNEDTSVEITPSRLMDFFVFAGGLNITLKDIDTSYTLRPFSFETGEYGQLESLTFLGFQSNGFFILKNSDDNNTNITSIKIILTRDNLNISLTSEYQLADYQKCFFGMGGKNSEHQIIYFNSDDSTQYLLDLLNKYQAGQRDFDFIQKLGFLSEGFDYAYLKEIDLNNLTLTWENNSYQYSFEVLNAYFGESPWVKNPIETSQMTDEQVNQLIDNKFTVAYKNRLDALTDDYIRNLFVDGNEVAY